MRPVLMQSLPAMALLILLAGGSPAKADAVIDISQVGSNVVATGSGSIDLTDLSFLASDVTSSEVVPHLAILILGAGANADLYTGLSGPGSFGSGIQTLGSSGSGDLLGLNGNSDILIVPAGYVSGTSLSETATFDNQTISGLGLNTGTFTYTWGTGDHADSLTIDITSPAAVPLPSPLAAASVGLILVAGWLGQQSGKNLRKNI